MLPHQDSEYLETPAVLRLTGLPASTLENWIRDGLVTPSVRPASGRRRTRRWSVVDVIVVRAIKDLRDAGCSISTLTKARQLLQDEWPTSVMGKHLYWDGQDLFRISTFDEAVSLVRRQGQTTMKVLLIPLEPLKAAVEAAAVQDPHLAAPTVKESA